MPEAQLEDLAVPADAPAAGRERTGRGSLTTLEISRRPNPWKRLVNIWHYRELLVTLTRKELKVKYKGSVLGFLWSLVNPALYIVVFSVIFGVVFKTGIHNFALLMMCGIVPWNFFVASLMGGTVSVTGNGSLVNKVWFPREVLPLASVGAAFVHLCLQSLVLLAFLLGFRQVPSASFSLLIIPALVVIVLLASGLAMLFSALNVYYRDVQHMVELLTLVWFWATPIVYAWPQVLYEARNVPHSVLLTLVNPLTPPVLAINRALFNSSIGTNVGPSAKNPGGLQFALPPGSIWWYARNLAAVGVVAVLLVWFALWAFGRLEDNFGEEL